MVKRAHLRRSVLWSALESVVTFGSAIVQAFVVARLIGPEAFGLASVVFMISSLFEAIIDVTFREPLVRRPTYAVEVADTAFTAMLLSGVSSFLLLAAISPVVVQLYGIPALGPLLIVQAVNTLTLGLRGVPEALLSRKLRFQTIAVRGIVAKLTGVAAAIGLALNGAGAWSIVLGNVAFNVVATLMVLHAAPRRPRLLLRVGALRELMRFGVWSAADALLSAATPRVFLILVAHLSGVAAAGALGLALRINDAMFAVVGAMTTRLALPVFSQIHRAGTGGMQASAATGSTLVFFLAAPVFAGLALISDELVEFILGPSWHGSAPALIAVCLFSICFSAVMLASPALKALGRPGLAASIPGAGFVYVMIGTFIAASEGEAGQLKVWVTFGILYYVVGSYYLATVAGVPYRRQLASTVRTLACCACMAAAVLAFERWGPSVGPGLDMGLQVILGVLAFAASAMILQRQVVLSILRR